MGAGSLQELDHLPIVGPVTKSAATVTATGDIPKVVWEAVRHGHDLPPRAGLRRLSRSTWSTTRRCVEIPAGTAPPGGRAGPRPGGDGRRPDPRGGPALPGGRQRRLLGRGVGGAARRVETLRVPCFVNGLGRGCLPADHELAFSRTRAALKEADVVVVVGTPARLPPVVRPVRGRPGRAPGGLRRRPGHPRPGRRGAGGRSVLDARRPGGGRRATDVARGVDHLAAGTGAAAAARGPGPAHRRHRPDPPGTGLRGAGPAARARTLSSSATAAISSPGPAVWSTRSSRDAGWTRAPTAASAPASATPWPPGWPIPAARSCSCSATGPPASPSWTSTPSSATACRSSSWSATTASGASRSTRCRPCTATTWPPTCSPSRRYDDVVAALGGAGELVRRPADIGPALDRALAVGCPLSRQRGPRPRRRLSADLQPGVAGVPPDASAGLLHELVHVHHHAGDLAGRDQAGRRSRPR